MEMIWFHESMDGSRGDAPGRPAAVARHASEKVGRIVSSLKELTLLEASELVKAIELTFGVDASASAGAVMVVAPAGGAGGEEEEKPPEKTEFDVVLKDVPKDKKISVLKVVRGILGVGLKEAKDMVDHRERMMQIMSEIFNMPAMRSSSG